MAHVKHLQLVGVCDMIDIRKEMRKMISTAEEMTNFTFKMDKKTREKYSALCEAFGLSMSAATLALVRQAVRSQTMTFTMRDANGFTPAEAAELKRRIDDVKAGKVTEHSIIED